MVKNKIIQNLSIWEMNMIQRIHMRDQNKNRIEDLMDERREINWSELLENIATLALIVVFLLTGMSA